MERRKNEREGGREVKEGITCSGGWDEMWTVGNGKLHPPF